MYNVSFAGQVLKRLKRLPKKEKERLFEVAFGLEQFPDKGDIRQMVGFEGFYRLRIGKWRYIFWVDKQRKLIRITKLDTRGDVYK